MCNFCCIFAADCESDTMKPDMKQTKRVLLLAVLAVAAAWSAQAQEWDCPERKDGDVIRVCGQNLLNYYYNYTQTSRPKYKDDAGLAQKTHRIVDGLLCVDADVYAFCELEAAPIILEQLVDSMNKAVGEPGLYAAVGDYINYTPDDYDNHLKSGFVYRTDRIETVGANSAATSVTYYKDVMRIQAFKSKTNGGKFVLSMNHFKAKDSSSDQGNSARVRNAGYLTNALRNVSADKDILILGDLNCTVDEEPMKKILSAGYEEQLLRYDEEAFSYCYNRHGQLIDHALANASMSKQVIDAQVVHICTTGCGWSNLSHSYSDHDPYFVDLCLTESKNCLTAEGTEDIQEDDIQSTKVLRDGQLYILLPDGRMFDVMGRPARLR